MLQDKEGLRASLVWHRRGGKDLTSVNLCCMKMFQRVGTYWHVLPTYKQGRAIVWDGMDGTGRPFLDAFPKEIVTHKNNVEMQVTIINGSKYRVVGSDNIDSLVGTNPIGVIFSEYSLQDPHAWDYIRPILAENGGWAMFIFTPRGKNHGYKLHQMAERNPRWFHSTLGVQVTKAIKPEVIEDERQSGMAEELIQQEYYCSFDAPLVGAYYSTQMENALREKRITKVPWDPLLPVHTIWDLGVDDHTAIGFMQEYGMEFRFIDFYSASGEGLPHYAKKLKEFPYVYGTHYAPHDIKVKELGTGKTRWQTAKELGITFKIVEKHEIADGIEQVRNILPRVWFDETKCEYLVEALKSYRKEYDEVLKTYRSTPLHDWSSHPADMFRYFAWRSKDRARTMGKEKRADKAQDDYNYLNG
jgi:phage terminase large subunit